MREFSLADRLEELRLARAAFPLSAYLHIVARSQHDCYINYCEGAYALYNWMTNNGAVQLTYQLVRELPKVSLLQANYFTVELAKILATNGVKDEVARLDLLSYYTRLIHYLLREIL